MVASDLQLPNPLWPIDRTDDGSVTEARSEHSLNAHSPTASAEGTLSSCLAPDRERDGFQRLAAHEGKVADVDAPVGNTTDSRALNEYSAFSPITVTPDRNTTDITSSASPKGAADIALVHSNLTSEPTRATRSGSLGP
jgi:hypothetical protein